MIGKSLGAYNYLLVQRTSKQKRNGLTCAAQVNNYIIVQYISGALDRCSQGIHQVTPKKSHLSLPTNGEGGKKKERFIELTRLWPALNNRSRRRVWKLFFR